MNDYSDPGRPEGDDAAQPPLRSPIRPQRPEPAEQPTPPPPAQTDDDEASLLDTGSLPDPEAALNRLRVKMERVATEFAQGNINRAQFNAVYARYSEQRSIIERLMERNPESDAWKQVVSSGGHTTFLRQHFEAQPLYYMIYRIGMPTPLISAGRYKADMAQVEPVIQSLWSITNRPHNGVARKKVSSNHWLILALGEHTVTVVMYLLEPSVAQANLVRDLHADFERANRIILERGAAQLERMVFPQRSLVEK